MCSSDSQMLVAGWVEHQRNATWPSEKVMPYATTPIPDTPV